MNKQKNQIFILVSIIIVGLLYVYVEYLFLPQTDILKEQTDYLAERKAYLENLEEKSDSLPELQAQVTDLRVQAEELGKKVPKELNKPEIMLTVYNMAKKNGLSPLSLTYNQPQDENGFLSMGLDFSCTGPEQNVYNLVDQFLKGDENILALNSISINSEEGGVSANMKLIAYSSKE